MFTLILLSLPALLSSVSSYHNSHTFSTSRMLHVSLEIIYATSTRHRTNFRPAEKFVHALRSHGTVQYFRSVYTELANQVEF